MPNLTGRALACGSKKDKRYALNAMECGPWPLKAKAGGGRIPDLRGMVNIPVKRSTDQETRRKNSPVRRLASC